MIRFIATLWFVSSCALAGTTLNVNPKRLIEVRDTVGVNIIKSADRLVSLAQQSTKPIYIFLNSPGGSVMPGLTFLDSMNLAKSRGVKLVCVSSTLAASMAFTIFAECDVRYSFAYTKLLWHPMKVGGMFVSFSADEMEYLLKMIRAWELPLNAKLIKQLGISKEVFYYHYAHETLFTATQLDVLTPGFVKIIDDIKGIDRLFTIDR